ncbi:uncharacterized protein LOC131047752 [Cryptomeria japonica]|uniref:uncharacterized protein LOC131047752 n=1 Tax=Cryptomeria japonica TaxID=3369 RepID=UPI0027D9E6D9|nr:uncharacterized protein LOC131047752 [Cryptomeria japonica]
MSAPHAILAQQISNSPAASVSPSPADVHHKVGASHVAAPTPSATAVAPAIVATTFAMEVSGIVASPPPSPQAVLCLCKLVQIPQCILASISFIALSCYLRKYGLRKFLFLDQLCDDTAQVQLGYTTELDKAFKLFAWILLPSFLIEIVHKILWYSTVTVSNPFISGQILSTSLVFTAVTMSWLYRTGVFLLVCMQSRLTCHLQILRFDGFRKFLEEYSSDVSIILKEHMRIRHQLFLSSHRFRFFVLASLLTITISQFAALLMTLSSRTEINFFNLKEHMRIRHQLFLTSHRFRFFVLASLLTITISQFAALLMTLSSRTEINFFNAGNLVVCSVVQVTGFLLCLLGAARITHRAQGTVSVATRWHVLATCTSYGSSYPQTENLPSPQSHVESSVNPFSCVDSASDSETSEVFFMFPSKDASAAFEIRQAFGLGIQKL